MRNIFTLTIALLVGGCAEGITVYHNRAVDPAKPRVITVDAKQRSLIMTPEAATDKPQWRVCAEAAPDVFSALSASASLEADVASKSGKAAAAIAESAATIERTQTINLLRESMYRTCERYLSGALDKTTFITQAARDQRSMVAVLAIEQLTGAFRRPSTILVAPSTSATTTNGAKAAELIEQFSKQKQDAIAAKKTENGKYNDALVKGKCDKITTAPADETSSPKLSEWTSCVAAKARSDAADAEAKAATERLDKVIDATMVLASTTTTSTGTEQSQNGAATTSPSDGASLQKVAEIVGQIAQAPGLDEPLMFCIGYLQSMPVLKDNPVINTCTDILTHRAQQDQFIREKNFALISPTSVEILDQIPIVQQYDLLRDRFAEFVQLTPTSDLKRKFNNFEKSIAGKKKNVSTLCDKSADCADLIIGNIYKTNYNEGPEEFEKAIAAWRSN